jgi:hypothetical protein
MISLARSRWSNELALLLGRMECDDTSVIQFASGLLTQS